LEASKTGGVLNLEGADVDVAGFDPDVASSKLTL
jgi:hypothetical protein